MFKFATPLADIPEIGPRFIAKLKTLGITTVGDLLRHYPTRYEDYSEMYRIADLEPGQHATIQGTVEEIDMRRSWQRNLVIVEAVITDGTGSIRAVWFNQPYVKNILTPGKFGNFAGKVSASDSDLYLSHPTYELIARPAQETKHTGRLVPVYPETRGLTSKGIRFLLQPILKNLEPVEEYIPEEILDDRRFPEINDALNNIHFPDAIEDALAAKKRFSFEELFTLQVYNLRQKHMLAREKAPAIPVDIERMKGMLAALPFPLTLSQKKSLWEIMQDIGKPHPMNRLLQGDVGSGKTVVAILAALAAAQEGYQTALMAPTEVLAQQHFETIKKLFTAIAPDAQASVALLTGHAARILYENDLETPSKKIDLVKRIARGEVMIVVGTHALIQTSVTFKNLGLIIIDEQHRFGVDQRAKLSRAAKSGAGVPHFLSMSATPIPRTLMLTVFGDLDVSAITELPGGRKKILTKVVDAKNRSKAYAFIRGQIRKGRQAFVICPRIDAPDADASATADFRARMMLDVKSVKEEFEKLSKAVFPDLRVAMLHGQMKAKEKESVMERFKKREMDILVSTSVIEVGVDVPNATIMMIEGSDRFGLAQLYQFRGRVGRGEHQSFCFLFTDATTKTSRDRLAAIVEAKNGFDLAEQDLRFRGPGEFLGQKQTGLPDVAMRGLQDFELIKESRDAALRVMDGDPSLTRHPALKKRVDALHARIHPE